MNHSKDDKPPFSRLFVICCKTVKEEDLHRAFGEFGRIENLHMPRDRNTGDAKGIAYVQYSKTSEAATALEALHGVTLELATRPLKVMVATNKNEHNQSSNINLEKYRRLFIVTPKIADEQDLKEHFSSFGYVESIILQKDKLTKQNKGFAYVQFRKFSETALALEECDRKYKPMIATPKDELKRDRSTFESNMSLNNTIDFHNDNFYVKDFNSYSNQIVSHHGNSPDGYKSISILCSPNLTQIHIQRLFSIVQGMEKCQYSVDMFQGCGKGIITYSNHAAAAYAVQKLDQFEYPLGEMIHVKPEINQINRVAEDLTSMVKNFKTAMSSGNSASDLAQLAEAIARASSVIKAVASGVTDTMLSDKNTVPFCNVSLPPPKPLADTNSVVAQRCFIVCKPHPPPMSKLHDVFSRFGNLIKIYIVPNKNFGYVLYASEKSAQEAMMALHKCTIANSYIKVLEADERNPKGDDVKDEIKKIKLDTMDTDH